MSTSKILNGGLEVIIDPNDAYSGIKPTKLLEASGLLPYFALEAALTQPESLQEAWDTLTECYGFGDSSSASWGRIEGLTYKSSEDDPDLEPMLQFKLTEDISMLVYQYAIVAVTDGTDTIIGRMD